MGDMIDERGIGLICTAIIAALIGDWLGIGSWMAPLFVDPPAQVEQPAETQPPAKQGISHRIGNVAREAASSSTRAVRQGMVCGRVTIDGEGKEICVERGEDG